MNTQSQEVLIGIKDTLVQLTHQVDALLAALDSEPAVPEDAAEAFEAAPFEEPSAREDAAEAFEAASFEEPASREESVEEPYVQPASEDGIDAQPSAETPAPLESESIDLTADFDTPREKHELPDFQRYKWMVDLPGSEVKNVISAISLNDRVLFINTLFGGDPHAFQRAIAEFNSMPSLSEALSYILVTYPDWDLSSDVAYRLMMAIRRKLR